MTRKTGDKWETTKCGRCGQAHTGLSVSWTQIM